ncbi:MAG: TIGR04282 family arsenosugar biosynthesis glycosyltransferase [Acidobacteriota bacterium]|nr:TIGR04282 family arsenosugar biosynthesis glycosyltransferase [Acidobacteriota bacterium]
MDADRLLLVFTKPARAGRVKTRLIGKLSSHQAAELHLAFLGDVLNRFRDGPFDIEIAWAVDDAERLPEESEWGIAGRRQRGASLGERLHTTLREAGRKHTFVVAIGSDHPELSLDTVIAAFEFLEARSDVVVGPAADGGYYLIGLRSEKITRALFEGIPWSTSEVFAETCRRCRELDFDLALLESGHDVDTPADLDRLIEALNVTNCRTSKAVDCPLTREVLESWGRLRRAEAG